MQLNPHQKLTLFTIDDWMAMTHKHEIQLITVQTPEIRQNGCEHKTRHATYKHRGKRKEFYLDLDGHEIVLDGWDHAIDDQFGKSSGIMHGNACFNFVSDLSTDTIRTLLEEHTLQPISESIKASMILLPPNNHDVNLTGQLIYPESTNTSHTVINNMKKLLTK